MDMSFRKKISQATPASNAQRFHGQKASILTYDVLVMKGLKKMTI